MQKNLSIDSRIYTTCIICCALFFSIGLPRLLSIGSYPYIDEGYYIFQAQSFWSSLLLTGSLPASGTLHLYSLILSPICAFKVNLFVWCRALDLFFSLWAGYLFIKLFIDECQNYRAGILFAVIFLLCMNVPDAIQAGAKNSFFVAFIPLLYALRLVDKPHQKAFFLSGVCTAVSVLLREPFVVYAVIGSIAILYGYGLKNCLKYCLGGICTAIFSFSSIYILRSHNLTELINAYINSGAIFHAEADRVFWNFVHYGIKFCYEFWPVLVIACTQLIIVRSHPYIRSKRAAFWFLLILAPLPEILGKICYLYHFSLALIGLTGFIAFSWKLIEINHPLKQKYFHGFCLVAILSTCLHWNFSSARLTLDVLQDFPTCNWTEKDEEQSNTLLVKKYIRELMPKNLVVSGFAHFLYPSTNLIPPGYTVNDLSRTYILLHENTDEVSQLLKQYDFDCIILAFTNEKDHVAMYSNELTKVVESCNMYKLVHVVNIDYKKNYGWLGYRIYKKISI